MSGFWPWALLVLCFSALMGLAVFDAILIRKMLRYMEKREKPRDRDGW